MQSALEMTSALRVPTLSEAVWQVQTRIRHAGRKIGPRSIGSTLLVKGLEFEHGVVVHAATMTKKDWYVALTRATKTLRIVAPTKASIASPASPAL